MNGDIFYRSADIMSNKNICKGTLREFVKKNISLAFVLYSTVCSVADYDLISCPKRCISTCNSRKSWDGNFQIIKL